MEEMENRDGDGDEEINYRKDHRGYHRKRKSTIQQNYSHRDENSQRYCSTPSSQLPHTHIHIHAPYIHMKPWLLGIGFTICVLCVALRICLYGGEVKEVLEAPWYDVKPLFILMSQPTSISQLPRDIYCINVNELSGSIQPFNYWTFLQKIHRILLSLVSLRRKYPPPSFSLSTNQSHHFLDRFALDLSQFP